MKLPNSFIQEKKKKKIIFWDLCWNQETRFIKKDKFLFSCRQISNAVLIYVENLSIWYHN